MPKIDFYHQYSDLDKHHEFGIVPINCGNEYFAWVFFYLGVFLGTKGKGIYILPYRAWHFKKPVKSYNINGADKCARLIANRINKIIANK